MSHAEQKAEMPPHQSLVEAASADLDLLRAAGLGRFLREIQSAQAPEVTIDGRRVLLLCSNNYLGLAAHPEVVQASCDASRLYGASAVSSRLISGHMSAHARLEEKLAAWKGCQRALVFSTGYQANIGVIASLITNLAARYATRASELHARRVANANGNVGSDEDVRS